MRGEGCQNTKVGMVITKNAHMREFQRRPGRKTITEDLGGAYTSHKSRLHFGRAPKN